MTVMQDGHNNILPFDFVVVEDVTIMRFFI